MAETLRIAVAAKRATVRNVKNIVVVGVGDVEGKAIEGDDVHCSGAII